MNGVPLYPSEQPFYLSKVSSVNLSQVSNTSPATPITLSQDDPQDAVVAS